MEFVDQALRTCESQPQAQPGRPAGSHREFQVRDTRTMIYEREPYGDAAALR
jgi:hypothetical protein